MFNTDIQITGLITKVDDDQRIVEGIASTPEVDLQGDVITADAMRKAIPNFMALPGGGNLREMHQPLAAGKIPSMRIDENGNTIISAKVVDDNAWKKIKEKVYTGFSIGGRVLNKIENTINELELSEISLVDRPANPGATFTLFKLQDMAKKEDAKPEVVEEVEAATEEVTEVVEDTTAPADEAPVEVAPEAGEVVVDETKQSADTEIDLAKTITIAVNDALAKHAEAKQAAVSNDFAKADYVRSLEERLEKVESTVLQVKAKPSYVEVDRFTKSDDPAKAQTDELAVLSKKIREGKASADEIRKARSIEFNLRKL